MVSAILMAGYNNKRAVKKYSRIVADNYGETFIETGYKALREFETVVDGQTVSKPLIQYTLERLFSIDAIDEIIIVGHLMLLKQRLGKYIKKFDKPCYVVNQNTKLSTDVIKRFNILPKKVKYNSIGGNFIKAYAASRASATQSHALFVAADSPLTTRAFMEAFLKSARQAQDEGDIILPIIKIDESRDKLGRFPVRLINDTAQLVDHDCDLYGRQGFRLSSLLYANPYRFDVNTINTAYSLRKALSPKSQIQLFRITQGLGYPNVYSKYFLHKDLSVEEVENITSQFFKGRLKCIPMLGEASTYDYDGTASEFRKISDMLKDE